MREDIAEILEFVAREALVGRESEAEVIGEGTVYEITAVPLRDDDGEVDQVLLLSQDITKFRNTQLELEARNRELRETSCNHGHGISRVLDLFGQG